MIDGAATGPDGLQRIDILVRAAVAAILVEMIAIARLLGLVAAGDDMHGGAATGDLVERREFPRRDRRSDEARPMGDQRRKQFRMRGDELAEQEAVRRIAIIADENAIEAARLVGLGHGADETEIHHLWSRRMNLRLLLVMDHPDELDRHRTRLLHSALARLLMR